MAVLRHVVTPAGVPAGRGYSQVVTGEGRLVVISGQVAQDASGVRAHPAAARFHGQPAGHSIGQ